MARLQRPGCGQEWAKTLTKIRCDAAGIVEPDKRVGVAGDPDSPVQHNIEVAAVIANIDPALMLHNVDPALMLHFRELSLELAKVKARVAAGVQPSIVLPRADLDG